jgi:hypothetical protein
MNKDYNKRNIKWIIEIELIFKEIRKNYDSDYSKNERINE